MEQPFEATTIPMEDLILKKPDSGPLESEFDLFFRNISYCVKQKHDRTHSAILKNLSGSFRSGRLVGIMGPSGAGKSTLLNVLSGFKKANVTGELMVDGQLLSERRSRKLVSYTQQEVNLWRSLTVEESLKYAAEFKLGKSSTAQKQTKVRELLEVLGLESCATTLTDVISGGQAKRLAIGLELLSDPKVMLLDEPTTGLDSVSAYQVLAHVRELAARGRIIACVIHQPNSQQLQLIDDLFVLARGRRIYSGPTNEMVPRFASFGLHCPVSYNPADYALDIASLDQEDDRLKRLMMDEEKDIFDYKFSILNRVKSVDETYQRYGLTTFQQLGVLLRRTALCVAKDSFQLKARFAINVVVALLISIAFYNTGNNADRLLSNTAVLIISLYAIFFSSIVSAVLVYPRESACFVQESKNNWYSLKAYYWAKIIIEIPTLFISSLVYIILVYYFTSQPLEVFRFVLFAGMCLLFGWISQMLGLLLGSLMSVQTSVFCSIMVVVPASLFSGFFIPLRDANFLLRPLMYVSFVRYAFEGSLSAIYSYDRPDPECPEVFCYFGKLKKFLGFISLPELAYEYDLLALFIWIVCLMLAVYLSLRRRIKSD
ncbi:ATP-binding cassette sub-family G member 4-like [Anopheles ziemanni]|uniref:ATP-binding cassette sub-family G member 4-like n=1 Tax=Anopheles coustani TaxID=139045 RepID=UPI00265AA9D1|nr:ATP-binding cassette sub-family G member 4-like [Anopheles coustani]XP_058177521.1 ATP-binding cassette sub-family G member 4-like [Anopheles ziemanni]